MQLLRKKWRLVLLGIALLLGFGWVVATQGPLAPIKVTVASLRTGVLSTSVFGIGTVEARRHYRLGPTTPSRVGEVLVDVGDEVRAGQLLAQMEAVDLDERLASALLAVERAEHSIRAAEASLAEAQSRRHLAEAELARYAEMRPQGFVSEQAFLAKRHEAAAAGASVAAAEATLRAARRDRERFQTDAAGIGKVREQLRLISPVDGIVTARHGEPGTTMVAGQPLLEVIDPASLWVSARIDQRQAGAVRPGQRTEVVLRSMADRVLAGRVERVDWVSDPVTEERSVQVAFTDALPGVPLGELVEVTVWTKEIEAARWIPSAAIRRRQEQQGVWAVTGDGVRFHVVRTGVTTLDGRTQILEGLSGGEQIVVHAGQRLDADATVRIEASLVAGRND